MKYRTFLITICCFALIFSAAPAFSKQFDNSAFENHPLPAKIDTDHKDGSWGRENNGLISKIWTEKREYYAGQPIIVYYIVKNISDENKAVWHCGFWENNLITVTMPDGSKVSNNDIGLFFNTGARDKNSPFMLKPEAIDNILPCYDLSRFFNMRKPGAYSIQYFYKDSGVSSNTLRIKVLPATRRRK